MKRIAVLRKEECRAPKDCPHVCLKFCPRVRTGDTTISVGEDGKPVIDESSCVGCNICVKKCEFGAISIVNLPSEPGHPIHRFGANGFEMFGLPTPAKGQIVGLLGPNGTGKSTAVDILSGRILPNLGEPSEGSRENVLKFFAGTELQAYFRRLFDGEVKLSVKHQNILDLPALHGEQTVGQLLKSDEQLMSTLELSGIAGRKISTISGGELQRLALALALAEKGANLYFFDEPSSFLDISQRLKVAKTIRSLSNCDTIVVEHDLMMLDYLSDQVYLFYGTPGVYGVVSLPKNSRTGINVYLDGYSRDENIRFRNEPIVFAERSPQDARSAGNKPLVEFSEVRTRLGDFHLGADGGKIWRGEVIGVVGPNSTGKTTFVRILAGLLKPDAGTVSCNDVRVSYKPQYLELKNPEMTVAGALSKRPEDINPEGDIIGPLEIMRLMEKKLGTLSGGELQRVAIAASLMMPADVYLLDEPAAFLDVEHRVSVAKTIKRISEKRHASAMVVDHDILFIDYLSDRLLVFNGTPSKEGTAVGPVGMREGMNMFLKDLGITMRRDPDSKRPRINKSGSKLDQEQKASGEFYYS